MGPASPFTEPETAAAIGASFSLGTPYPFDMIKAMFQCYSTSGWGSNDRRNQSQKALWENHCYDRWCGRRAGIARALGQTHDRIHRNTSRCCLYTAPNDYDNNDNNDYDFRGGPCLIRLLFVANGLA